MGVHALLTIKTPNWTEIRKSVGFFFLNLKAIKILPVKLFLSKTKPAEIDPRVWLTSRSTGRFTSLMPLFHTWASCLPCGKQLFFLLKVSFIPWSMPLIPLSSQMSERLCFYILWFLWYTGIKQKMKTHNSVGYWYPVQNLKPKVYWFPNQTSTGKGERERHRLKQLCDQICFHHQKEETNPNL